MKKTNLLGTDEKLFRDVSARRSADKDKNKAAAKLFGAEYFDGTREQGYGGYVYDGRWVAVARRILERYKIPSNGNFLDVGCAKGFLLHDIKTIRPDINVFGVDISNYALEKSLPTVKEAIKISDCTSLAFPDNFFDAVVCINTIHNLDYEGCKLAINELKRVAKRNSSIFIQVDAYTSDSELAMFQEWVLTAETYMRPDGWCKLFDEVDFQGDYFWTIIGFSDRNI